eukprot:PRCOL_00000346-RA
MALSARSKLASTAAAALRCRGAGPAAGYSAAASAAQPQPAEAPAPPPDTMSCTVDGREIHVAKGSTVLQACDAAGVDIPRFCYHQRLSIAGNCRMCLVEVEKAPKPVASCAMPLAPGMNIKTDTPLVKKAREGVMEFLLANHPLDCPICDQGGECDLQDQSMMFGSDRSRFTEAKRGVEDKNLGPLVKTVMTRCIHCTRCVRFATEVAGVPELGTLARGRESEIGTYVERLFDSELSGNVIDLCPVGALTSKPYAFTARSWELKATESIDTSDALGAHVRVDSRGTEVMRVVPRLNEDINEEWITDRARFSYDGLKRQRLDQPYVRKGGVLQPASWPEALGAAAAAANKSAEHDGLSTVVGSQADAESMTALKDMMASLGCSRFAFEGDNLSDADLRSAYTYNSGVAATNDADAVLYVGCDPRKEAPIVSLYVQRGVKGTTCQAANIGEALDLQYDCEHLGETVAELEKMLKKGGSAFGEALRGAERPQIIVGSGVFKRADSEAVMNLVQRVAEKTGVVNAQTGYNGLNVLHAAAARTAALDLGLVNGPGVDESAAPTFVYLLGADDFSAAQVPEGAFVVYQGSHGDAGASRADVVLPGCASTEKAATYVNTEGRVQRTRPAAPLVGDAREDWTIVRALSEVAGSPIPHDDVHSLRARMADISPTFDNLDVLEEGKTWITPKAKGTVDSATPLASGVENFYQTDAVSRASSTMARARAMKAGITPRAGLSVAEASKWDAALGRAKQDRIKEASNPVNTQAA